MKKSIRILAFAVVAVMLCLSLAACGKTLSGTYEAQVGGDVLGYTASYKFSGSKVEVTLINGGQPVYYFIISVE